MTLKLKNEKGKTIFVEPKPFNSGGQGGVHHLIGNNRSTVAKIFYHETKQRLLKAKKLESRIKFMIENSPIENSSQNIKRALIWPKERLYLDGNFVGFSMPMAGGSKLKEVPIKLTSLTKTKLSHKIRASKEWKKFDRNLPNSLKTRLKLCYNIARAIDALHQTNNYILVDLKPDNILINSNGWMSIIDLDSIQISKKNKMLFPAEAFTQEYIPPEWQNKLAQLKKASKNVSWDRFCYAVLAYQLLLGIHPYTASHRIFHEPTDFIREGLFPNGSRKKELDFIPPTHNSFDHLPKKIQLLFLRCFETGHQLPSKRPSLEEWAITIVAVLNKPPRILWFKSNKKNRDNSDPIRLSWKVENAKKILINGRIIKNSQYLDVSPTKDTSYILEVFNNKKSDRSKCLIQVDKRPPEILFFKADKTLLTNHLPATVSWEISRSENIVLNGIRVNHKGIFQINPKVDTEYYLRAKGFFGQVTEKRLYIRTSKKAPQIIFFKSNNYHRKNQSPISLSWNIIGAHSIKVNGRDVSKQNSLIVDPRKDTLYVLHAKSYFGIESKAELKITISKTPPSIKWFKASSTYLETPVSVEFRWKVIGGHITKLKPLGIVTNRESCIDSPLKDTLYTLHVENYFGIEAKKSIEIKTSKKVPKIKFEIVRLDFSSNFKKIKLVWDVSFCTKVEIDNGIGIVTNKGNLEKKVEEDTRYTLKATSPFGIVSNKIIRVKTIQKPSFQKNSKKRNFKIFDRDYKLNVANRKWNN